MMLKDLTDTPVLNPDTGMRIGCGRTAEGATNHRGGIVAEMAFKKPATK
jgi:hypothetical protein